MSKKLHIGIVIDSVRNLREVTLFKDLLADYNITVFTIGNKEDLVLTVHSHFDTRVFDAHPEMPGYIRNLEEELKRCDVMIGYETSRFTTFQARRIAAKERKPFGVVISEFHPFFYAGYPNIKAMQTDILQNADVFWATSKMSHQALQVEGADIQKIKLVYPAVDTTRFKFNVALRQKFRKYIGLREDETVVLFENDLEPWSQPEQLMEAMRVLYLEHPNQAIRTRALFVGNGSLTKTLKYAAVDSGLGRSVMFLHQDPEPFIVDLYSACDIVFYPRQQKTEHHEKLPLKLLEAMACGMIPIVPISTIASDLVGNCGKVILWDSSHELSCTIASIISDVSQRTDLKNQIANLFNNYYSGRLSAAIIKQDIYEMYEKYSEQKESTPDYETILRDIEQTIKDGNANDALISIEDALLKFDISSKEKAEFVRLKADISYYQGHLEQASKLYNESVMIDEKCFASYRGMGYVAWQNYTNEEALLHFKKALSLKEDDAQIMLGFGLVFYRLQLFDEALFWLEKTVISNKSSKVAVTTLANACRESSNPSNAIKILEQVIEIVGDIQPLVLALGHLYMDDGKTELGTVMLQKALEIH